MDIVTATWLARLLGGYVFAGLLFSSYFVVRGVRRIDPNAGQGSWGFRLLIFPGTVALWPVLLRRLIAGQTAPPQERNAHRMATPDGDAAS